MTTMLEKSARAAGEVVIFTGNDGSIATLSGGLDKTVIEAVARAVLMAVRIPDDAMEDAGEEGYRDNAPDEHSRVSPYAIGKSFTAMIDAILNEGKSDV